MFSNRTLLTGNPAAGNGTNVFASSEASESWPGAGSHSVWWEYVPRTSGTMTVSTLGSSFDTILAVYSNPDNTLPDLVWVGENDDCSFPYSVTSCVTAAATANTSYVFQVVGYNPLLTGQIHITVVVV